MLKKRITAAHVRAILSLVPHLLTIRSKRAWINHDEDADVLYLNFKKPSHADDSELTDDDMIIRYEKGEVVGITVLHASKRKVAAQLGRGRRFESARPEETMMRLTVGHDVKLPHCASGLATLHRNSFWETSDSPGHVGRNFV